MRIEFDSFKRAITLAERGLDFKHAVEVFEGPTATLEDVRKVYGERRFITYGLLDERIVVLIWTKRNENCRIISMRKANEREITEYAQHLG